jgi:hypothetical protein
MDMDYTQAKIDFAKRCLEQNDGNTAATAGHLSRRMPKDAEFSDLMGIVHTAQAQLNSDENAEANTDSDSDGGTITEVKTNNEMNDGEVKRPPSSGGLTSFSAGISEEDTSGSSEMETESEASSSPDKDGTSDRDEGGATSWSA